MGGDIVLLRVKDRLGAPSFLGDVLVNLTFASDPRSHVCELQLVHAKANVARKSLGGHESYSYLRGAASLIQLKARPRQVFRDIASDKGVTPL